MFGQKKTAHTKCETARSTSGEPISAGTIVKVDRIEGVKAFVSPVKEAVEC